MTVDKLLEDELFKKKSLAALIFLIDCGRELEFGFDGKEYFMSKSGSAKHVSVWQNEKSDSEQSFESVYELICNANINGKAFCEVWENFELKFLL